MLLGTLGPNLLENMLAGQGMNRAEDSIIIAGYASKISMNKNF